MISLFKLGNYTCAKKYYGKASTLSPSMGDSRGNKMMAVSALHNNSTNNEQNNRC